MMYQFLLGVCCVLFTFGTALANSHIEQSCAEYSGPRQGPAGDVSLTANRTGPEPPVERGVRDSAIASSISDTVASPRIRLTQFQLLRPAPQSRPTQPTPDPTETVLGQPQKFPASTPIPGQPEHPRSVPQRQEQRSPATIPPAAVERTSNPPPSGQQFPSAKPSTVTIAPSTGVQWIRSYESTARRPIEVATCGTGKRTTLIIGSIYGNEPESIELLDLLVRRLNGFALPADTKLILVRTPNPDGLAERIRTNHNGVDLNRNFPSTWFTSNPTRQTGPHPASEIETQHMLRLLREIQPQRVVHLRSSLGQRPLVLLNQPWYISLERNRLPRNIDVGRFEGEFKAGSLEEFVHVRLRTELATVHLPPRGFQQLSADELLALVLGAPSVTPTAATTGIVGPTENRTSPAIIPAENRSGGQRGPVELLPPPPEFSSASASSRYYELPPPPQP